MLFNFPSPPTDKANDGKVEENEKREVKEVESLIDSIIHDSPQYVPNENFSSSSTPFNPIYPSSQVYPSNQIYPSTHAYPSSSSPSPSSSSSMGLSSSGNAPNLGIFDLQYYNPPPPVPSRYPFLFHHIYIIYI